jgi:hypothetical protein
VIVQRDAERLCHGRDLPRHLDIGLRGRRIGTVFGALEVCDRPTLSR